MTIDFDIGGGLIRSLELMGEAAADIGKPLRKWAADKRKDAKARIESEEGMPPLSPATLEKRQRTGTSKIAKHGNIRVGYSKYLDREAARMRGLIAWSKRRYLGLGRFAMPADIQAKVARWSKRLDNLNKQIVRAQDTEYQDRKIGKTVFDRKGTKMLPRLPGSIKTWVKAGKDGRGSAVVYSRAGIIGKIHNDGGPAGNGAQIPARRFLELTSKDVDSLTKHLVEHGVTVLEERR